jgi:hypothetical protein
MSAQRSKDAVPSTGHFEFLAELVRDLRAEGFGVYSHRYEYLAFGSWMIDVGTRHRRLRLSYDGKEGSLQVSRGMAGAGTVSAWEDIETSSVHGVTPDLRDRVLSLVRRHLA